MAIPSASGGRCDAGRAGAACAGTGWSAAAGTAAGATAAGIEPGWPGTWAAPGPAGGGAGTAPSAVAAGGSWDCCVVLVTPRSPGAAAVAVVASDGEPVGVGPEKMVVGVRLVGAEGLEVAAEQPLRPHHPAPRLRLEDQPCCSAAASGGGAGVGASAGVQRWPAAELPTLGSLGPEGPGALRAAEAVDPDPQREAASQAVP